MRYAKFCEGQLFARRPSLPPETLSALTIPNYQLPITNYPLPDIPHLYEKGYINIKNLKLETSNFRFLTTPRVGFEPTTDRLTADCSTAELPRIEAFWSATFTNSTGTY